MWGGNGSRGVSEVLGAILVFAILVSAISLFQVTIVPQTNEEAEFKHNQRAQGQLLDVQNALEAAAARGSSTTESVDLGPSYPTRTFLVNPGEGAGSLRTDDPGTDIEIANAEAVDTETADWWDGSGKTFDTRELVFEPNYNYYREAPVTRYENSVLYNEFDNGNTVIPTNEQDLVQGRTISLVSITGQLSASQTDSVPVETRAVSGDTETISVEADGGPITISVPTSLEQSTWEDILSDQTIPNGGHIIESSINVNPATNQLTFQLEQSETYDLRVAQVKFGSSASSPGSAYVVSTQGDGESLTPTQSTKLTVQVRDEFNGPVSGEEVTFTTSSPSFFGTSSTTQTKTVETDENGYASVTLTPGSSVSPGTITATAEIDSGAAAEETATFEMDVSSQFSGTGGFGQNLNPAGPLVFEEAEMCSTGGGVGSACSFAEIRLRNDGSQQLEIKEMRVNVYVPQSPGGSPSTAFPDNMKICDSAGNSEILPLQGPFEPVGLNPIPASGGTETYTVEFDPAGATNYQISPGDYFVVSVTFGKPGGGTVGSASYIIAPTSSGGVTNVCSASP